MVKVFILVKMGKNIQLDKCLNNFVFLKRSEVFVKYYVLIVLQKLF